MLLANGKFVDELTKIVAPGLEEMRDGGQDYEVMFGKMPCATPAHACTGLLSVRRLLALSFFFARDVR